MCEFLTRARNLQLNPMKLAHEFLRFDFFAFLVEEDCYSCSRIRSYERAAKASKSRQR